MASQPETKTAMVGELAPVELERQERANAPTLRDLRKAAQELGLAGAFTDQPTHQQVERLPDGRNGRQASPATINPIAP
jgi:hypothetical protein